MLRRGDLGWDPFKDIYIYNKYNSTLAASTLILLFSGKFSPKFSQKPKNVVKQNVEMKISK